MLRDSEANGIKRRGVIKATGAVGIAGLAGCLSGSDDSDGFLGPDGQVELTLIYTQGSDTTETTAEFIGQELEELGFSIELESVSFDNLLSQYVANEYVGEGEPEWDGGGYNAGPREETESEHEWDLMYGINFNTYPRTPAAIDAFWRQRASTNYYGYEPEVDMDAKFAELRTNPDQDERQEIMNDILGTLSEDQPVNFVAMSDDLDGYQSYVEGPEETFGANWDYKAWSASDGTAEFVSGDATDAETLYFPEINDVPSGDRVNLCLDGSYAVDENNEVVPLWLDITDTGDGQVYVCELRDNLEFGGGYGQMTAEDWVFQIEEVHMSADMWDEETPPSTQTDDWAAVENVEQTGELEFQLELADVNPDFPLEPVMWSTYCAPKELYESYAPDAEALRQSDEIQEIQYGGNLGAYTFDRWDRSSEFVAVRNDDYYLRAHADELGEEWADAPYFDSYTYRVVEEQSTRMQALRQDELTYAGVSVDRYQDFVDYENVDVYEVPQPYLTILAYNQRANGWDQLRTREVRQALSHAIDKNTITQDINRGLAETTHTFQPQWSPWYDDSEITEFGVDDSYDKSRARELLAEHTSDDYGYDD